MMDISAIVESALVTSKRDQAWQALVDRKQNEIQRLNSLLDSYRTRNADHERLIGKLHQLLKTDDIDGIRDLVEAEHDAIHGPNG